jgi:methyl-accepting chemotaxis protein
MTNRAISVSARGDVASVAKELAAAAKQGLGGAQPVFATVFASTAQPLSDLMPKLAEAMPDVTLLGASTAGEVHGQSDAQSSATMVAFAGDFKAFAGIGSGLAGDVERAIRGALEGMPTEVEGYPHRAAIMMIDGLSFKGEEAALTASMLLGPNVPLAGGSAGDDLQMQATWVGAGPRAAKDGVAILQVFAKTPIAVGVAHGHKPLPTTGTVTRASGPIVHEIDGKPAWQAYVEGTRAAAAADGIDASKLNGPAETIDYFARYETGFSVGGDYKVRASLVRNPDDSLSFVCDMPEGTQFSYMHSSPEEQVRGAREAALQARAKLGGRKPLAALVFDCACRKIILKDGFEQAISAISAELGGPTMGGFLTYGEICLDVGDMSGFHNSTCVVLAFAE